MGGTTSKNTLDVLNQIALDVAQSNTSRCVATATQQQIIEASNVAGDFILDGATLSQGVSINMDCLLRSDTQAKIQSEISTQIAQYADSQGQAMLSALGKTSAEAAANIKTLFSSSVKLDTLNESITKSLQVQTIRGVNIGGDMIVKNVTMSQTADVVAKALIQSSSYAEVINTVAQAIDQKSSAKEESPLQGLFDMISGGMWLVIGLVVAAAVVVVVFIRYFFNSGAATETIRVIDSKVPAAGVAGVARGPAGAPATGTPTAQAV